MSSKNTALQQFFSSARPLQEKNIKAATIISFLLLPMSGLITDMYIPSMPHMAIGLNQSEASIQLTLTLFLVSYGAAQFITGSLIDSYGRYRLTLFALVLFILSNFVVVSTNSIEVIYTMRIIQGISTGFIVVAKRAFFVDVYEGEQRKHYLSMLSIVWSVAPVAAPFAGGYLQQYFSWQSNFYVLAFYGIIMLTLEWAYGGETTSAFRTLNLNKTIISYTIMFRDKLFFYGIIVSGLSYGTTMIFGLAGAFIIEHEMHFSAVTAGYGSLAMGLAWMAGGFIGKTTIDKPLIPKLKLTNNLQIAITLLMICSTFAISNIGTLILFAFLIHICVGFIFNNYFAFCLGRFPKMAGLTSGLSGGSTFVITAISSYAVVALIHPNNQTVLGSAYLIMGIISLFILHFLLKPFNKKTKAVLE